MSVVVDGCEIGEESIRREAQYHPASNFEQACKEATQALVVRTLLVNEALRQGITKPSTSEKEEQDAISDLMDQAIEVPAVDEGSCVRYFEQHPDKFRGPDLFASSHILIAAEPDDEVARSEAKARALQISEELHERPERFEKIARASSGCPSGARGGNLGQLTRGDTMPEFESALIALQPGWLSPEPVETPHGYHIIRLDDRALGEPLPFSAVSDRIMIYLRDRAWRKAVSDYIVELARASAIEGFTLESVGREGLRLGKALAT